MQPIFRKRLHLCGADRADADQLIRIFPVMVEKPGLGISLPPLRSGDADAPVDGVRTHGWVSAQGDQKVHRRQSRRQRSIQASEHHIDGRRTRVVRNDEQYFPVVEPCIGERLVDDLLNLRFLQLFNGTAITGHGRPPLRRIG